MKILGIDTGSSSHQFRITEEDRIWVEENFRWLKNVFGYPNKMEEQVLLASKFFPATFAKEAVSADNVITDLCTLFGIPRGIVKSEILTDLRDYNDIPYQIEGKENTGSLLPIACRSIQSGLSTVSSMSSSGSGSPKVSLNLMWAEMIPGCSFTWRESIMDLV